ncbi:MAG: hypothetical protein Q8O61_14875 [Nocardioides sp.]|nr:hypothetical protein [Nocardioides sp.]
MRPFTTSRAVTTSAALAIALLAGLPAAPGAAVVATDTVAFGDCEVDRNYVPQPGETSWTPTVTIDHPSPVPTSSPQTIEVTLSSLPGGTFPEDYPDEVDLEVLIGFEDGRGGSFDFEASRPLASFDADAALSVGEFETDLSFPYSGVYGFKPKSVRVELFGIIDPGTFDYVTYHYECDQVVDADPISQIGVYDPTAAAAISLDRLQTRQGAAFAISGTDFPREAVQDPDKDISVFVGAQLAGSFDVDDIGAFVGVVRVPEFARPGAAVVVRASAPGESASSTIGVRVKPATVKAAPTSLKAGAKIVLRATQLKPGETAKIVLTKVGGGKGTKKYVVKAKVGAAGTFTKAVKLTKAAKGPWRVAVSGPASYRKASARFRVR